ncbi:MAG: hypothetical protein ACRDK5_06235 [Solirubrobacterales bacterium]
MTTTRRRIALTAAATALLAAGAAPASASATVFCVPDNAVHGTCQTAQADLQTALNSAEANVGSDTVRLGAGTFTAAALTGFRYESGNGSVSIIGSGEAQTTLTHPPDPGNVSGIINNVLYLDSTAAGSSVSNLTASIPLPTGFMFSNQHRTVQVPQAQIDHVTVTAPGGTALNAYGFWLDTGSTTIDNSTVSLPAPGGQFGVITNSSSAAQVEDSTITARAGFLLRGTGQINGVKRSTINVLGNSAGIDLEDGTLNLESSVIDLGATSGFGVYSDGATGPTTATLNLDNATIVGTNAGAAGVRVQAIDAAQADTLTANLTNSVISGPGTPIRRDADQMDTANVITSYSNYNPAGNISSNGANGMGAITESNRTNLAPGFINPATGDYHLISTSQLIDIGDPAPPAPGALDIDGDPRALDGLFDCVSLARRDIGADEFVGPGLMDCTPPSPADVSSPDTSITGKSKVRTRKKKARVTFTLGTTEPGSRFECSVDSKPFSPCLSPFSTRLRLGKHLLMVRSTDLVGNADATPASFPVKVKPKR